MKLAHKLTLALTLGISAVMVGNTYFRVQREIALFEDDQASDQRTMGRDLQAAAQAAWQTEGEEPARRLIEQANVYTSELGIHWVWLDALGGGALRPTLSADQLHTLAEGREITLVWQDESGTERRYTYVPMSIVGARAAAIELSEVPSPPRSFIRTSMVQNALETLVIVTLCGLIAMGLGSWFVGQPMHALCEKARRVGTGDFSGRLDLHQRDEIGELAAEIDVTCDRLAEANRRVAAETEARIATLEQLRHADRLKTVGQLASGVAHELGTPLNVISGRANLIAGGDLAADEVAKSARVVVEQAERMAATIRQLLDFSRRRGPRFRVGDLHRIAGQALEMLSSLAEKRGVTVRLDDRPEPMLVHVDENQVLQALTNLILNGIQAMPRGGRLTVGLARRRLRPPPDHGGSEETYVCITVEDEGEGIAPDAIPHLFEPFFTTKGVGEGTGLGLSVAYGIVREHGGWIDVESAVGTGSRFSVFLRPAESPPAHAQANEDVA
jgi:two-component system NtrC family sensor kinase